MTFDPSALVCALCGRPRALRTITYNKQSRQVPSACPCTIAAWDARTERVVAMEHERKRAEIESELGDSALQSIARYRQMDFDPWRAAPDGGDFAQTPYATAVAWLDRALACGLHGTPMNTEAPPALLLIYGANGSGKTHLAAHLALRAWDKGKIVAYLDEPHFINKWRSAPFGNVEVLADLAGDVPWLTVIDHLGYLPPSHAGREAWSSIIGRRAGRDRWTIVCVAEDPQTLLDWELLTEPTMRRLLDGSRTRNGQRGRIALSPTAPSEADNDTTEKQPHDDC